MSGEASQIATCCSCRAVVLEGFTNCNAMFHFVLEREYSDSAFGEAHLFTVDAYALQHSEEHGPRSNAFHLMRLCWLIERDGNQSIRQGANKATHSISNREEGYRAFPFLAPPQNRGELTVASVVGANSPAEHTTNALAWGRSVWSAWQEHHAWARHRVAEWFLNAKAQNRASSLR
jgi:hypothetical protein